MKKVLLRISYQPDQLEPSPCLTAREAVLAYEDTDRPRSITGISIGVSQMTAE